MFSRICYYCQKPLFSLGKLAILMKSMQILQKKLMFFCKFKKTLRFFAKNVFTKKIFQKIFTKVYFSQIFFLKKNFFRKIFLILLFKNHFWPKFFYCCWDKFDVQGPLYTCLVAIYMKVCRLCLQYISQNVFFNDFDFLGSYLYEHRW